MEAPTKRKYDADCPRITYDAPTKVFDRLFKEESLEEMKNVVRKKLDLSPSLPVHLSQLRDGKSVVLEDDDDFDAFCVSVYSTPLTKIKVYFGNHQPPPASSDAMTSLTVDSSAADDHRPSKRRKVSFIEPIHFIEPIPFFEPIPEPLGANVNEPDSSQSLPNSEAPPEVPATIDLISANREETREMYHDINKNETGSTSKNIKKGKAVVSTSEDQSLENTSYDSPKVKIRHPRKDGRPFHTITITPGPSRADSRTEGPEESEHHTSYIGQADPWEVDVLPQPPMAIKKSRKKGKESDASLNTAKSTKGTSSSAVVVQQPAKKQDPKPTASTSALETNSKGKTRNSRQNQSLKTPIQSTLNEILTQLEQEMKSSASIEVKTPKKKSRKRDSEVPVEPADQDQLNSDVMAVTRAAVDAILARTFLPNRDTPTHPSPLVDITAPLPVTSSSPPDTQPKVPNNASTTVEQSKTVPKCPICEKTPSHVRSRCPIIRAGIKAMRQRIAELQRDVPECNNEERENAIEELQRIIDKRTRHKPPPAQNQTMNVESTKDKPVTSLTLATDSSPAVQPPKTSEIIEPAKGPPQEIESMPSSHSAEFLSFGDVSSYTAQDLEALIRGPKLTLADVPSSDSSEDEETGSEEEPEEVQDLSSRSQGRIRYPSSTEGEDEDEEEASPFVPSIIPLPIKSASELSNEDESSRSRDFQHDIPSFHEVNGLGSSLEVDRTGDDAVHDAYALDFAHLSAVELSQDGRQVVSDDHILNAQDENQALEESGPKTLTIATPQSTPQSDPIEASEKPEFLSPPSPIVSSEEDIHPLQSTPNTDVAVRRSQRNSSNLVRKSTDLTLRPHSISRTGVDGVNGINNNSKLVRKTRSLTRITDLPVPINPAIRVIKGPTLRQTARVEDAEEKADEQGPTNASQTKPKNGKLAASKTSSKTTKTQTKTTKTPAKAPIPSDEEELESQSVTVVQDVSETIESAPNNPEQSLATWAVLEENSQLESETAGMMDELHSSLDMHDLPPLAQRPTVNGVSKERDPLFLHSDSQQSFPYSQYPNSPREPLGSQDEEDEVEASVVKPQMATKSSSKFRSLTEIASQPALFTPRKRPTQPISTRQAVMNLYGRVKKDREEESDSDSESDSDAAGANAQMSHIPISRRAGNLL